jgi:hypothetical protein
VRERNAAKGQEDGVTERAKEDPTNVPYERVLSARLWSGMEYAGVLPKLKCDRLGRFGISVAQRKIMP